MRINRVILQNYGLYSGRTEIDLVPRRRGTHLRPIILIGGMNGAGKTTLLDGLRLALYGKSAVGERLSQKAYEAHLRGMVHRSKTALIQVDEALVGLEFDLVTHGKRETYYVQRSWKLRNGEGVDESLSIQTKPDDPDSSKEAAAPAHGRARREAWPKLEEVDTQHLQDFLDDVVPERLSQLFFFDGEKIKRIADDISGDAAIAEAIRSLLGLDTVDILKSDLAIVSSREESKFATPSEAASMEQLDKAIQELTTAIGKLNSPSDKRDPLEGPTRPSLESALAGVQADIKNTENELRAQGGTYAQLRSEKQTRKASLKATSESLKKQIRQACEGLFPLALCPRLRMQLDAQIGFENRARTHLSVRYEMENLQATLVRRLATEPDLRPNVIRLVTSLLKETVEHHFGAEDSAGKSRLFLGLSEADSVRVQSALREAAESVAPQTQKLCDELDAAERELVKVQTDIDKAPEQSTLEPIFAKLSAKYAELAQYEAALKQVDERIIGLNSERAAKVKAREELIQTSKERARSVERVALLDNLRTALDKYLQRLAQMKIDTLCRTVADCFNHLSRKGDVLNSLSINPKTFEVTLRGHSGHIIPREELSAGEKQILAISILWALSKTSGRPLPVIIDTPLGRLDSNHRLNLVQNYFPHASHQVVLLSTDTEVDKKLLEELNPHISHCHHLIFDKGESRTYAREEYFWKD